MKRRTFCAAGIAALATASFPYRRVLGAVSGELGAIGLDGKQLTLSAVDIADLRAALRGELLTAGDAGYDASRRLWNPAFDYHPALIARCRGAADVVQSVQFARTQGVIPAPETGHAVRATIDEALRAKEEGLERVILLGFSGHGLLDLQAYDDYHTGRLDAG